MEQLDALRFTRDEEAHDPDVYERHLIQVEHELRAMFSELGLQFVQVLRRDATDEPQRRGVAVGRRFDPQGHLGNSSTMRIGRTQAPGQG